MRAHLALPTMTTSQPNLSMTLQHFNTYDAGYPDQVSPSPNNSQRVQTTSSCPNLSQINPQPLLDSKPSNVTRLNTMPSMSSPRFESLLVNSNSNPFNSNIHDTPIHRLFTHSKYQGTKYMKKVTAMATQKNTAQAPRATQGMSNDRPYNAQLLETVWPSDEHAAQRACFTKFLVFVQQQSLITPTEQTAFFQLQQQKWDLDFDAMGPLNTGEDEIGDKTLQDAINQSELMQRSNFLLAIGRGEPDGETMLLLDMASLKAYSIDVNTSRVTDEIAITHQIGSTLPNN